MNSTTQKRVCIIGGGASGITAIKQLLDEGHVPVCFERSADMGGVFNYKKDQDSAVESGLVNGVYKNTVLTISNYLMCFSDLPPTGRRRHWHHTEYRQYLSDYIDKFNLAPHINLQHTVTKVVPVNQGTNGYQVTVQDPNGAEQVQQFDALAVCSGTHQIANIPNIKGLESFAGKISHGSQYNTSDMAKGKHVLCVGLGESSADITREISETADECHLALRSYPFLIPRNLNHSSSDAWTSRLHHDYHTPKHESAISYLMLLLYYLLLRPFLFKRDRAKMDSFDQDTSQNMLDLNTPGSTENVKLIKAWNYLSKGRRFATKNVTFVPNIINGKIQVNASGIDRFTAHQVIFNDGTRKDIDLVMFATGYKENFDFIEGFQLKDNNVRNLFMNSIPTDLHNCAFIGWARPVTGGIPACSEMAARYFALLVSGKRKIPADAQQRIAADQKFYHEFYSKNSPTLNTVVGWKRHLENLAELIGCQVHTARYILQPGLFVRLFAGSLVPSQYRLEGPHAMPDSAARSIREIPITLPSSHILYGIKMNLSNKFKFLRQRALARKTNLDYSEFFSEWFRFDIPLTLKDIHRFSFRADDFNKKFNKL